eukprot:CAMPEP_0198296558 /NCGR_PEP_ID=MMETSP1449-20131203/33051_1 /TAXON_ID=420275 /ORGANISM="Attheya septentrionalis, Strain CCMP2084" /LENGTH=99 /DNA_ID=CAMNT_0043997207 /DNA_START=572 /DNA_END=868 /DNA_ORIENTATION=+
MLVVEITALCVTLALAYRAIVRASCCLRVAEQQDKEDFNIPRSNLGNNHDNLKHSHTTRESAKREVLRMKTQGYKGSARLNEYYNSDLNAWFVGKSSEW